MEEIRCLLWLLMVFGTDLDGAPPLENASESV